MGKGGRRRISEGWEESKGGLVKGRRRAGGGSDGKRSIGRRAGGGQGAVYRLRAKTEGLGLVSLK